MNLGTRFVSFPKNKFCSNILLEKKNVEGMWINDYTILELYLFGLCKAEISLFHLSESQL